MTLELGGNIVLEGFDGKDFTELIVVKKMVGQYARQLSDTVGPISRFTVGLEQRGTALGIQAHIAIAGKEYSAHEQAHNLYVALDGALRKIADQARSQE